ncbi:DNA binding domain-containing protein, excisionase family [Lentzea albidocapillata subsp. violacea]|uniref:DNA binding domain-containing protein, excisionase family n=1 Tax=Lentzea albidocapillata subsp. violacea TaxID=128104 RepID=A0A1G9YXB0_9PSEU|nr:helix-turn-helix domain-containing protein [Lentzea albidocapillata]SDN13809.1 DNA binding domain-containing protein, excisionase family [Lentzea albidocapillata subsp. violacea]
MTQDNSDAQSNVGSPAPLTREQIEALPEVLNVEEAAAVLRLKVQTLRKLATKGDVPGGKLGGEWRFLKSRLLSLLDPPHAGSDSEVAGPPSSSSVD